MNKAEAKREARRIASLLLRDYLGQGATLQGNSDADAARLDEAIADLADRLEPPVEGTTK